MQPFKVVYGAGGFGREIMETVQRDYIGSALDRPVFAETHPAAYSANGISIFSLDDLCELSGDGVELLIAIAIGSPLVRAHVAGMLDETLRWTPWTIVSSRASVDPSAKLGSGSIVQDGAKVAANASLGQHCHVNYHAAVCHDALLGNFVTVAPFAGLMGNTAAGSRAYIGAGAQVRERIVIGEAATVGMGAIVLANVAPDTTVAGNPARALPAKLHRPAEAMQRIYEDAHP